MSLFFNFYLIFITIVLQLFKKSSIIVRNVKQSEDFDLKLTEWQELFLQKKCTVIGLGVSNLPLIDFLLARGAGLSARDRKSRAELAEVAKRLESRGVELILGEGYLDRIDEDIIFRSPGVHPASPAIEEAVKRGALLTSEMELFFDLSPAPVIGVSGSDGKTTTTTLTYMMLREELAKEGRRVFVGGNIGEPLLPRLDEMNERDLAVVELSSFQLYTMRRSPWRAAVTNLSPNHLNWHVDMDDYVNAKTNIYRHAPCERAVFNAENDVTATLGRAHTGAVTYFSSVKSSADEFALKSGDRAVYVRDGVIRLWDGVRETDYFAVSDIRLPGKHNLENYMTAIALTDGMVSPETAKGIAQSFGGVEHRLELVRTVDGVRYYNSSIDSSPTRTAAALSALTEKAIVICGGSDKGVDFMPLAEALCARAKAVILLGETREKIDLALRHAGAKMPIYRVDRFDDAVRTAREIAEMGDTVLLSPACASFDMFRNFAERGETFKRIVCAFEEKE
ncbi:MAG: UDP-N-acetylmuramoyl-L-alanine--D-glutamate ligase [Clostridia bacterium]|nr:UDP-N-acetylmuramoyl-L-alanine--D-glutamate ligase [Clostridia bacterium]